MDKGLLAVPCHRVVRATFRPWASLAGRLARLWRCEFAPSYLGVSVQRNRVSGRSRGSSAWPQGIGVGRAGVGRVVFAALIIPADSSPAVSRLNPLGSSKAASKGVGKKRVLLNLRQHDGCAVGTGRAWLEVIFGRANDNSWLAASRGHIGHGPHPEI